jgi:HSP20 family protein
MIDVLGDDDVREQPFARERFLHRLRRSGGFDDALVAVLAGVFQAGTAWSPNIDVFEKDNRLIARVDLPGTKKEEVKVEVVDGWLTISGDRKYENEEEKENVYRCEREYGTFYRALPLPEGAKVEEVKAFFENGVLEVTVPLVVRAANTPRTVAIEEPAKAAVKTKAA